MAHINELIDFTVSVLIVHKDKVLIRKHEKYHRWLAVGGHIELDEDANTAALREVKEEVGLDVELIAPPHFKQSYRKHTDDRYVELIPPFLLNIHDIDETHKHHDFFFIAKSESNEVVPENPDDEWMWITRQEVTDHPEIEDRIKNYALLALEVASE